MARNRMLQADDTTCEAYANCSRGARYLFDRMACFCDDGGVHPDSAKSLKMSVFPGDEDLTSADVQRMLDDQVRRLTADPAVEAVAFWIDTPGGTVMGTPELADAVAELSKAKPTVGFIDGLGASAGYFVASQMRKLYATKSSLTGSIGSLHIVPDFSAMMERSGIKVHVIATGELKGTGVFGAPLTPDQIDYLRDMVSESQAMFDLAVQTGRRMNLAQMKAIRPGQVFYAATARKMGLIDGLASTLRESITLAGLGHLLT